MKARDLILAIGLATALVLGACNKAEPTPEPAVSLPEGDVSGPGGVLQGGNRLALGLFKLEETGHAVRPEQAARLLPLWKVIQSGSLQGAAETEAVLKQIEGVLDEEQLAAIEGMDLTFQEMGTWMQSPAAQALGIEMPTRPEGQDAGAGAAGDAGAAGRLGGGGFQNMTEEQRTQLRQEFQNMSAEQRATRMAEQGVQLPEGGAPGGGRGGLGGGQGDQPGGFAGRGGDNFLVDPLIDLLGARAAE